jgi:aminoglycoside phosphotransferase (APT) family kinase protein
MERLSGVILRPGQAATMHDAISTERMRELTHLLVDNLAAIHAVDLHAAGLMDLGRPEGYVTRQIEGWTRRYSLAQTDDLPELAAAADWLDQHRPTESTGTLIHNDYKFDNVLFDPGLTRIVGTLDWEMCTVGDPLMDLGTTLGYWIEPEDPAAMVAMFGLTVRPGLPRRRDILARYQAASGHVVESPLFYYVYGLFKIAVIVQQIYARYRRGHTRDARFAGLHTVVEACGIMAAEALTRGRISHA